MKRNKRNTLFSWLLLFLFAAGQVVLFTHQHKTRITLNQTTHHSSQQTVIEKCQLCDAMHHNHFLAGQQTYFQYTRVAEPVFISETYRFVSIALILSAGRSPPLS